MLLSSDVMNICKVILLVSLVLLQLIESRKHLFLLNELMCCVSGALSYFCEV